MNIISSSKSKPFYHLVWLLSLLILANACTAPSSQTENGENKTTASTATRSLPTATAVQATITSVPPTATTTPVLPTESPTQNSTPTVDPIPWPTTEAVFDGVRVTYFNNAGFMVVLGDTKILIDILYDNHPVPTAPDRKVLERAVNALPPFDQADLILSTHDHNDHFSAELVRDYLRKSQETVFVSSSKAIQKVSDMDGALDERLIPVSLSPGENSQLTVGKIQLDCFYITHGDDSILNIGFAISVDGTVLFHSGDMNVDGKFGDAVSLADLQAYGLPEKEIDIAFLPSYLFLTKEYRPLLEEGIKANFMVPMHYAYQHPPTGIESDYPNVVVFQDTMASWVLPQDQSFPAPANTVPELDGILTEGEWAGAYQTQLSDGSALYLMQDNEYLYVGIAASEASSGVGSLCVAQDQQVKILHSSAALGTAIFEQNEQTWELVQEFSWRCRGVSNSQGDQNARQRFLESNGWLANNGLMGNPGTMEYKIALGSDGFHLGVVYRKNADLDSKIWWPLSLNDSCNVDMLLGRPISDQAKFFPEFWVSVTRP